MIKNTLSALNEVRRRTRYANLHVAPRMRKLSQRCWWKSGAPRSSKQVAITGPYCRFVAAIIKQQTVNELARRRTRLAEYRDAFERGARASGSREITPR